ncbi:hypothetical protein NQ317_002837 [Molorchus minor]|uniref:Uncharacterized protein n=1 Tax=Molorchus minor TaxID=1323400 RepID=A0ABQ9J160_9CUCU|nr:hypothetical protein NQ317_002837 [Molorchus minor]
MHHLKLTYSLIAVNGLNGVQTFSAPQKSSTTASNNTFFHSSTVSFIKLKRQNNKAMATVKIPEQKVILCGEYGVGKSSVFRRFTNNTFVVATDRKSTLGLDHFEKNLRHQWQRY